MIDHAPEAEYWRARAIAAEEAARDLRLLLLDLMDGRMLRAELPNDEEGAT